MKNCFITEAIKVIVVMSIVYFAVTFVTTDFKGIKNINLNNIGNDLKKVENKIKPTKEKSFNPMKEVVNLIDTKNLSWANFENNVNKKIDSYTERSNKWKKVYKSIGVDTDNIDFTKMFFESSNS